MNKIPQHKASQYSEYRVVLHRFDSHDISHAPVCYAHQDDYYVLGLLTRGKACGIIDFKELQFKEGEVVLQEVHQGLSAWSVLCPRCRL